MMADISTDQSNNQLVAADQTSNTHSNPASQQSQHIHQHHHHHHQQQQQQQQQQQNSLSAPNQLHQSQMTQAHQQAQQQQLHQQQQTNLPGEMANGQLALCIRLLMQGKEAGSIIGKKGDNIRRFRETSGAKINVSDSSCPDRIVTLAGTLDEVYNALSMICYKLEEQSNKVGGNSTNSNNNNNNNTLNANNNNVMTNIPSGQQQQQATIDVDADPNPNAASVIDPLFGISPTGIVGNALKDVVSAAASMNSAVKVEDMLFLNNNSTSTINNNNISTPSKNHTTSPTSNYNNNNNNNDSNSIDGALHPMVTLRLIIPASQCGSLIGRGGTKIKEIRELTSAAIQVAPDVLPNSTERVVTIIGNVDSLRKCAYRICLIILESPPKGYTVPYRPKPALTPMLLASVGQAAYNIPAHLAHHLSAHPDVNRGLFVGNNPITAATFNPNLRAAAAASGQIASALSAVANQSVSSHEMVIPNGLIGCVIGKGGSKINEIRQLSGATIKISNSEEGTKNRTITISGTPEAINLAQYLITASVSV